MSVLACLRQTNYNFRLTQNNKKVVSLLSVLKVKVKVIETNMSMYVMRISLPLCHMIECNSLNTDRDITS